jgi:hypothetical protein
MASSTATSKASSSSACALCSAPLCSFYRDKRSDERQ